MGALKAMVEILTAKQHGGGGESFPQVYFSVCSLFYIGFLASELSICFPPRDVPLWMFKPRKTWGLRVNHQTELRDDSGSHSQLAATMCS